MMSRVRGFTLIELMVVMAIAVILMAVGVPSFKSFIEGQRAKTAAGELVSSAMLARSEAIKRNIKVGLYPATGGWANGWTVTIDKGGTKEALLLNQSAMPGLTFAVTSGVTGFVFDKNGRLEETDLTKRRLQMTGAGKTRCLQFDLSGNVQTKQGACA